ncbi:MAG TPA: LytR C-terminal domain-containing protein [Acidimicrobiales bacterium]|nr:LytR C-terminal domain-containing protein [Acidimicrobiales bacterium]
MRPASHAAADGSFGRSAGVAAGRAAMLLGTAILIGLLLLNTSDAEAPRVTTRTSVDGSDATVPGDDEGPVDTVPAARPPGEVKVLSANATRTEGAAGRVTEKLRLAGYLVVPPTDAPRQDATVIHFAPGYEVEAQIIAEVLGVPLPSVRPLPTPAPIPDLRDAHVLVMVGPELANPATTTTAAAVTTTSSAAD